MFMYKGNLYMTTSFWLYALQNLCMLGEELKKYERKSYFLYDLLNLVNVVSFTKAIIDPK